jgi:hypothetical protein
MAPQLKRDLAQRYGGGEFCDVNGAAAILNVSPSFLNKARLTGGGPVYAKFGRTVRYPIDGLLEWAASRQRRSTSEATQVA